MNDDTPCPHDGACRHSKALEWIENNVITAIVADDLNWMSGITLVARALSETAEKVATEFKEGDIVAVRCDGETYRARIEYYPYLADDRVLAAHALEPPGQWCGGSAFGHTGPRAHTWSWRLISRAPAQVPESEAPDPARGAGSLPEQD